MALAQQGKTIDEKLLDNYTNRGTIYSMQLDDTHNNKSYARITNPNARNFK